MITNPTLLTKVLLVVLMLVLTLLFGPVGLFCGVILLMLSWPRTTPKK